MSAYCATRDRGKSNALTRSARHPAFLGRSGLPTSHSRPPPIPLGRIAVLAPGRSVPEQMPSYRSHWSHCGHNAISTQRSQGTVNSRVNRHPSRKGLEHRRQLLLRLTVVSHCPARTHARFRCRCTSASHVKPIPPCTCRQSRALRTAASSASSFAAAISPYVPGHRGRVNRTSGHFGATSISRTGASPPGRPRSAARTAPAPRAYPTAISSVRPALPSCCAAVSSAARRRRRWTASSGSPAASGTAASGAAGTGVGRAHGSAVTPPGSASVRCRRAPAAPAASRCDHPALRQVHGGDHHRPVRRARYESRGQMASRSAAPAAVRAPPPRRGAPPRAVPAPLRPNPRASAARRLQPPPAPATAPCPALPPLRPFGPRPRSPGQSPPRPRPLPPHGAARPVEAGRQQLAHAAPQRPLVLRQPEVHVPPHRPFGRPRMRSATMFRWICEVPAAIV